MVRGQLEYFFYGSTLQKGKVSLSRKYFLQIKRITFALNSPFVEPDDIFGLGGGLGGRGGLKSDVVLPGIPLVSFRHASVMASASPSL